MISITEKQNILDLLLNSFSLDTKLTMNFTSEGDWPKYTAIKIFISKDNLSNDSIQYIKSTFETIELHRNRLTKKDIIKEKQENVYASSFKSALYPKNDKIIIQESIDSINIEFPSIMITDLRLADNDFNQTIKKLLNAYSPKIKHEKFFGFIPIPTFFTINKQILSQQQQICTQVFLNKTFGFSLDSGVEPNLNKIDNTVNTKPKF